MIKQKRNKAKEKDRKKASGRAAKNSAQQAGKNKTSKDGSGTAPDHVLDPNGQQSHRRKAVASIFSRSPSSSSYASSSCSCYTSSDTGGADETVLDVYDMEHLEVYRLRKERPPAAADPPRRQGKKPKNKQNQSGSATACSSSTSSSTSSATATSCEEEDESSSSSDPVASPPSVGLLVAPAPASSDLLFHDHVLLGEANYSPTSVVDAAELEQQKVMMKTRVGGGEALEGDDSQLVARTDSKRKKKKKKKNSTPTTSTTATTTTNATTTTTASSDESSSSSSDEKRKKKKKKKNKKAAQQVVARSNVMYDLKSDNHLQSVARQGGTARELKTLLQQGPLLVLTVILILAAAVGAWFFLLGHLPEPERGNVSGAQVVEHESPVASGTMQTKELQPQQAFVQKRRKKTNLRGGFAPPTVQDKVPPASSDGVVASTPPYQKDCDEATSTPSGVNCTPKEEKDQDAFGFHGDRPAAKKQRQQGHRARGAGTERNAKTNPALDFLETLDDVPAGASGEGGTSATSFASKGKAGATPAGGALSLRLPHMAPPPASGASLLLLAGATNGTLPGAADGLIGGQEEEAMTRVSKTNYPVAVTSWLQEVREHTGTRTGGGVPQAVAATTSTVTASRQTTLPASALQQQQHAVDNDDKFVQSSYLACPEFLNDSEGGALQRPPTMQDLMEAKMNSDDEFRPKTCPKYHMLFQHFQGLRVCPDYYFSEEAMNEPVCQHTETSYTVASRGPSGWWQSFRLPNDISEATYQKFKEQAGEMERANPLSQLQLYNFEARKDNKRKHPVRRKEFCLAMILGFADTAFGLAAEIQRDPEQNRDVLASKVATVKNLPDRSWANLLSSRFMTQGCHAYLLDKKTAYSEGDEVAFAKKRIPELLKIASDTTRSLQDVRQRITTIKMFQRESDGGMEMDTIPFPHNIDGGVNLYPATDGVMPWLAWAIFWSPRNQANLFKLYQWGISLGRKHIPEGEDDSEKNFSVGNSNSGDLVECPNTVTILGQDWSQAFAEPQIAQNAEVAVQIFNALAENNLRHKELGKNGCKRRMSNGKPEMWGFAVPVGGQTAADRGQNPPSSANGNKVDQEDWKSEDWRVENTEGGVFVIVGLLEHGFSYQGTVRVPMKEIILPESKDGTIELPSKSGSKQGVHAIRLPRKDKPEAKKFWDAFDERVRTTDLEYHIMEKNGYHVYVWAGPRGEKHVARHLRRLEAWELEGHVDLAGKFLESIDNHKSLDLLSTTTQENIVEVMLAQQGLLYVFKEKHQRLDDYETIGKEEKRSVSLVLSGVFLTMAYNQGSRGFIAAQYQQNCFKGGKFNQSKLTSRKDPKTGMEIYELEQAEDKKDSQRGVSYSVFKECYIMAQASKVYFIAPTGNPRKKIKTLFHATRDNVHSSYQSVIKNIGALSSNPVEPTSEDVDEVFRGVRETLDWQVLAWLGLRVSKANSLRLREHPVDWSEPIMQKYQPGLKQTYGDDEGDLKTFLKKKREDETQGTFALNVGWFTTYDLLNRLDKISDVVKRKATSNAGAVELQHKKKNDDQERRTENAVRLIKQCPGGFSTDVQRGGAPLEGRDAELARKALGLLAVPVANEQQQEDKPEPVTVYCIRFDNPAFQKEQFLLLGHESVPFLQAKAPENRLGLGDVALFYRNEERTKAPPLRRTFLFQGVFVMCCEITNFGVFYGSQALAESGPWVAERRNLFVELIDPP
ncbi:unnamed protein product [Amoebophrya sp. A120]|nr:unnamed protein product [Amoebophrya sp. A120]|eukprot:GSA120T00022039001.1